MSAAISVILALAYMAVVVMTMQELSLPQRLWIHRSIFGQHNLNYYNSEPFGGDTPTSASAEEWKDYQRRALNEEAQALAMLVSGITLEISTKRINEGATALVPKNSTEENRILNIKLSIPEKINGRMIIKITEQDQNNPDLIEPKSTTLNYKKDKNKIKTIEHDEYSNEENMALENGAFVKNIKYEIPSSRSIEINFIFYEESNIYIPMAGDKFKI